MAACLSGAALAQQSSVAPATEPGPAASPAPYKNTVKWSTNGLSNFGYDIYRAESEAGPFVKVNKTLLPGGSGVREKPTKETFTYIDEDIDPRKEYWYYVEATDLHQKKLKFTPTLKAAAKLPPASVAASPR